MADTEAKVKFRQEWCRRCGAARYSRMDLRDGQYHVDIPTRCPTKDRCHAEMKPGR